MKKVILTLMMLFSISLCFADVSYKADTLTLSNVLTQDEINHINNGDYKNTKILIIETSSILNQMKFDKLTNIETLVLPSDATEIPMEAFKDCKKLNDVNWKDLVNLKTIGEKAFMNTSVGPTLVIPNSVENIMGGAFEGCDSIKTLIFNEESQIQHIYPRAFYQSENVNGKLSDVYINVKPAREIICDSGAFDKYHACGQTQVGTVTTRLHYPPEFFEYYVGLYKQNINGGYIIEQNHIDQAYSGAGNGWQQFMSSGIPIGSKSLYRTFSDNVAYKVPSYNIIQVYLVVDYDKSTNIAKCIQMKQGDTIPARTGIIVHSDIVSTVYLEYVKNDTTLAYNNELYPNNLYTLDGASYRNYLKPINGELHIDNVEIVNGIKTYRNYFFNKGTTAASMKGPDWKADYAALGWGFFRAVSADYRVFNKAFLHLPASMTEASSEHINGSGNLPQDNAGAKESFGIYIINAEDLEFIVPDIPTAIQEKHDRMTDNSYYTLEGLKIENPSKGIYIKNGKKFVVK